MKQRIKDICCESNSIMKCYNTFIRITCTTLVNKLIGENDNCISIFGILCGLVSLFWNFT